MNRIRTKKAVAIAGTYVDCWALFMLPAAWAGHVIDRIVATVNGHIILQSDWDEALSYEALLNGRALSQFTDEDRRAVLDRLIDQELLGEQMKSASFQHASESEAAARVAEARKQYPEASTDEGWSRCWPGSGCRKKIWWRMCSSRSISCDWWMHTFVLRCRSIPRQSKPITGRNSFPS